MLNNKWKVVVIHDSIIFIMKQPSHIFVVAGPTASGKSDFAVELALNNSGEIISADSRQIYKGLNIGTGKITEEEMKGVPHYMLDICELDDEYSVALYKQKALPILNDILSRGKTPIICGGTGQYIDSLIFNTDVPAIPPNNSLRKELEKKSTEELYDELLKKDSRRAENIDKYNRPRLIRALEIINEIGAVPESDASTLCHPTTIYIMSPTREQLKKRITARLEKRIQIGMIDEVKNIMNQGYNSKQMKKFGLEYEIIGKYIEGIISEEEMKKEIVNKSMQYAKRQETWNKKYTNKYPLITTKIKVE